MSDIKFGIVGDLDTQKTSDEDNPLITLRKDEIANLITNINDGGIEKEKLFSRYGDLKDELEKLIRLGALREENKHIYVNFIFIDREDNEYLFEKMGEYAKDLSEKLLEYEDYIFKVLDTYENKKVDVKKLSFMIIGCYLLDWGMLEILRAKGIADHRKQQPGGNEYVLWGETEFKHSLKEIYWGGHAFTSDGYLFHTFGDHSKDTKRYALPDIIYGFKEMNFNGWNELKYLFFERRKELLNEFGNILVKVGKEGIEYSELNKKGYKSLDKKLEFLRKTNYLGKEKESYYLKIPYFEKGDIEFINNTLEPLIPVVIRWVENNLENIKVDLEQIKARKNKVPFEEIFIQIWHYIFGLANKQLVKDGFIYDTYSDESYSRGYQPALMEKGVLEEIEDRLLAKQ